MRKKKGNVANDMNLYVWDFCKGVGIYDGSEGLSCKNVGEVSLTWTHGQLWERRES